MKKCKGINQNPFRMQVVFSKQSINKTLKDIELLKKEGWNVRSINWATWNNSFCALLGR